MSAPADACIVVGRDGEDVELAHLDADGVEHRRQRLDASAFPRFVSDAESGPAPPRWVWSDTARRYPPLLAAGVRVRRCRDLRLCHAILRDSELVTETDAIRDAREWDAAPGPSDEADQALFSLGEDSAAASGTPDDLDGALREFVRQRAATRSAREPGRIDLLCAAESAGALVAAEMRAGGLPWDVPAHERMLEEILGRRPHAGGVPERMVALGADIRLLLEDPQASLDSPAKLLRSLHRVGVPARTTAKWELREFDHPVIEPLLEYKRLSRLLSANGWAWLAEWVQDGRFRPVYLPAGVVTGRWASSGGGALQIPRRLRAAVRADAGWTFVVADVAQLEPRVLAGMSSDRRLADAAHGHDLYAGIVDSGAVATRAEAKVAMLGAMYGSTTGESGRLLPRLAPGVPARDGPGRRRGPGRSGRRRRVDLARSLVPAGVTAVDADAAAGRRRDRHGRRARSGTSGRRGSGPVHAQLRRAGHRGRMGAGLAGRGQIASRAAASGPGCRGRPAIGSCAGPRAPPGVLPARRADRAHAASGMRMPPRRSSAKRRHPPAGCCSAGSRSTSRST
ncbi:bifunctional 3'-5' exonuclease/DNA polymerase [Microbacterium elymi]|uniref:DNA-directed DNA polymerase n=1 Tax=Microbacterium elymi TaxID=2909587 RepID=A0ABY5NJK7_9MICO|nr:bifunctional 3'-5' exonuclease/DNA polymerase [Microbacterium elymi]UUT35350.1 bifunctional 3'-5' exonuclease/DNA polymerase [Microbacterium elymi]